MTSQTATAADWLGLLGLSVGGLSTSELAADLQIRPYTVQDIFKALFVACGVRSRGALLGRLLEPRPCRLPPQQHLRAVRTSRSA